MAFKCPSCGGHVHYNISKKNLICDYCGRELPLNGAGIPAAEESEVMNINSFVCKSCGAEVLSPDESMLGYCSYCGSESMLESRLTEELKPKYIMPFSVDKAKCKDLYKLETMKIPYLPRELKDSEYLEKFRGTYIPYWMYKMSFPGPVQLMAKSTKSHGDEITETTYDIEMNVEGEFEGVPYDASSCFDDTISDMLMPFDKKKLKDFHPGYLAGFYADRADVPAVQYLDDANERAAKNAFEEIDLSLRKTKYDLEEISDNDKKEKLSPTISDRYTALFPVWFLTWRKRDRLAYAIVNGESGRISCDLPVDLRAFTLYTLGTALAIFAALMFLVSMTARTALSICTLLTLVIMVFFNAEVKRIRDKENHVGDKGFFVKNREVPMPEKKRDNARRKKAYSILKDSPLSFGQMCAIIIPVLFVLFVSLSEVGESLEPSVRLLGLSGIYLIIGTYFFLSSLKALRYVKEKAMALYNLLAFGAVVATFIVAYLNPASDYMYYLAAAGCGLATALSGVGLIRYYNYLTTRPLPSFFDREGGRDNAKD